jgi:Tfp pilus assembly protein FimV
MALYLLIIQMNPDWKTKMKALFVGARCACVMSTCLVVASVALPAWAQPSTYEVKPGDTVEQVIRHTMGDSPLKTSVLRQALIAQNPQAFTKSTPRVLIAGAVLKLPNADEFLRQQLPSKSANPAVAPGGYTTADMNMNERKNWVRFP